MTILRLYKQLGPPPISTWLFYFRGKIFPCSIFVLSGIDVYHTPDRKPEDVKIFYCGKLFVTHKDETLGKYFDYIKFIILLKKQIGSNILRYGCHNIYKIWYQII